MRGTLQSLQVDYRSQKHIVSIALSTDFSEEFDRLYGKDLDIDFKVHREKRSKDANAYMWVLCEKLAKAQGISKEEVYRANVRQVGVCEPLPIKDEAVDKFAEEWGKRGIGWFVERTDKSKIKGYTLVFAYYGSSTYTTKEMSLLIDYIVQDCVACGIPTDPREELQRMLEEWDRR